MDKMLEQIKQLATANDDIAVLWLYGSRAKGMARPDSDYDLAVAFSDYKEDSFEASMRANDLAWEFRVELGLEEKMLSVVDINHAPLYLAFDILNEGQIFKGEDASRPFEEYTRVSHLFEHEKATRPKEKRFV